MKRREAKRREAKSKGDKERYKHLNAEFQRIARRDKKVFFSDQCKEIEEKKGIFLSHRYFSVLSKFATISCAFFSSLNFLQLVFLTSLHRIFLLSYGLILPNNSPSFG